MYIVNIPFCALYYGLAMYNIAGNRICKRAASNGPLTFKHDQMTLCILPGQVALTL